MWIELHLLQNFAPSCLNRDDTNSPKDCVFGGYRRARISSQCIKRAIRTSDAFQRHLDSAIGVRTKRLVELLTEGLAGRGEGETAHNVAVAFTGALAGKMSDDRTSVLLYLGEDEVARMVDLLDGRWDELSEVANDEKKLATACTDLVSNFAAGTQAADISLFGRMVAEKSNITLDIDAACQVAHAISTNRVSMEMDFYTAVDDLNPKEETGAPMMGVIGYNSACFYRYALVDYEQLLENLGRDGELAAKSVVAFVRASALALPTGKQNTFAAHSRPDLIVAVARQSGAPLSMANAFVAPVRPERDADLTRASIDRLADYWSKVEKVYGNGSDGTAIFCCGLAMPSSTPESWECVESLDDLVDKVEQAVTGGR